jgi:hypothetical protein
MSFSSAASTSVNSSGATSITATLGTAVPSGGLLYAIVNWEASGTFQTLRDDKGNDLTLIGSTTTSNGMVSGQYKRHNCTDSPTAVTLTMVANTQFLGLSIESHDGVQSSSDPLDGTNFESLAQITSPGTGANAVTSGSATKKPSANNYLVLGGSVNTQVVANGSSDFTAGTTVAWTIPANAETITNTNLSIVSEYFYQGTAAALSAKLKSNVGVTGKYITHMAVFKTVSASAIFNDAWDVKTPIMISKLQVVASGLTPSDLINR